MNLERIEELSLACLRQAKDPLVPVSALLKYCHRDADLKTLDERELISFLRPHPLVRVIDPPNLSLGSTPLPATLNLETRLIYANRMPSLQEMSAAMQAQIALLVTYIEAELEKAGEESPRAADLRNTLNRLHVLRDKLAS